MSTIEVQTAPVPEVAISGNSRAERPELDDQESDHPINIPMNLEKRAHLPEDVQAELTWFHQHIIDNRMGWLTIKKAVGFDKSTVYRALLGIYGANYKNVVASIQSYRRMLQDRSSIQQNEFVENPVSKLVFGGLKYALANNSITIIIGESRSGKTVAAKQWKEENNHGRAVYVEAPPIGGAKRLINLIATAVGIGTNKGLNAVHDAVIRAFNKNRLLIVDEAHRLMPDDPKSTPRALEMLRDLHDRTRCGLALIATGRLPEEMARSSYMYEQVLGRIGLPVRIHREMKDADFMPIVRQYLRKPGVKVVEACRQIANEQGRLGVLVEVLKVASRIASSSKTPLTDDHVFKSIALRREMMGETMWASKK